MDSFVLWIIITMFVHLRTVTLKDKEYVIWNNARYEPIGQALSDGSVRYRCVVRDCNNAIYVKEGRLLQTRRHDDVWALEHTSDYHPNPDASYRREKAIESMNLSISLGSGRHNAYDDYVLTHPRDAAFIPYQQVHFRLDHQKRHFPNVPAAMEAIPQSLEEQRQNGWTLNHYGHKRIEYEKSVKNMDDSSFKRILMNATDDETKDLLLSKKTLIKTLQNEVGLLEAKLTTKECIELESEFYLGEANDGKLIAFGEKMSFEIAEKCYLLLFDGSFKFTPLNATQDCDMQWIIHAVMASFDAGKAHESFTIFHILFKAGKHNHREEDYAAALQLIIDIGIERCGIDLSVKHHRAMADYEKAERKGIIDKMNITGNVCDGCGYHFVMRIQNGLKEYGLWKLYLEDYDFWRLCRCLMSLRDVPPMRVREGFMEIYKKIPELTPTEHIETMNEFMIEYVQATWLDGRYRIVEWNGYRKEIRVNNFAESANNKLLNFLGVHPPFYEWLSKLKRFSALNAIKWRQFEQMGFVRKSKVAEHLKTLALQRLWDLIGNKSISLWKYMEGVSICYSQKWGAFDRRFGSVL